MKKMWRMVTLLVFVIVLATGCGDKKADSGKSGNKGTEEIGEAKAAKEEASQQEVQDKHLKIGISMRETKNPFYKIISDTIVADCKEKDIEVVALDAANSLDQQTADLENLMAQECNVLIFDLLDPDAFSATIEKARDMGIYCITVNDLVGKDTPVNVSVLTDNFGNGELVGNWAAEKMGSEPIKALLISGEIGNETGKYRRDGTIQGILEYQLSKTGKTNFEVVYQIYCDGWNVEVVNQKFEDVAPTLDFNLIISESDVLTQYCYDSLEKMGLQDKVLITSAADGEKSCLEMVKNGEFDVTAMNSPSALGHMAFTTAVKLINGESVAKEVYTEATCVTAENVDQYYNPDSAF